MNLTRCPPFGDLNLGGLIVDRKEVTLWFDVMRSLLCPLHTQTTGQGAAKRMHSVRDADPYADAVRTYYADATRLRHNVVRLTLPVAVGRSRRIALDIKDSHEFQHLHCVNLYIEHRGGRLRLRGDNPRTHVDTEFPGFRASVEGSKLAKAEQIF